MYLKYGLQFPEHVNDLSIELKCYRMNHPPERGGLGAVGHMRNVIQMLWPEKMPSGRKGYLWSNWTTRRVQGWCEPTFKDGDQHWQTWWGPSSSGKSTDAALIALVDWMSAPDETTTIVCSTTKDMLEKRIFGELLKYHGMYSGSLPGQYYSTKHAILLGDENSKNGIFGIAIQKGSISEAIGNIIGVHNRYNRLIIDEMQSTKEAAVDAADNLSTGQEFKFLGMGNPETRLDPLGRYSEPLNGWESVSPEDEAWETKYGKCLYFDGLKSPAVKEPKKYWFLLNMEQINDLAKKRGRDSPQFWSQRRGFVPPEGLKSTVITENYISKFHLCNVEPQWVSPPITVAGLDPSYSAGGDDCVLKLAQIGTFMSGVKGINFLRPIKIQMQLSGGEPQVYNIANQVQKHCEDFGIEPSQLAMDITGAQGMLADVLEKEWGPGIYRVDFAGSPSDLPASSDDPRPAKEVYANRVTELWFNFAEFARKDQIRGVSRDSADQFCSRLIDEKNLRKIRIESKRDMKLRTGGQSPDDADSDVVLIAMLREKFGIHPGNAVKANPAEHLDEAREYDIDSSDDLYLTDGMDF